MSGGLQAALLSGLAVLGVGLIPLLLGVLVELSLGVHIRLGLTHQTPCLVLHQVHGCSLPSCIEPVSCRIGCWGCLS